MDFQETSRDVIPPSTTKEDPQASDAEERKEARRLRIQRRLEAIEKTKSIDKRDETPSSISKLPIINQEEKSDELLKKLSEEGKQL
ncbi:hypothetical protein J437_LFUL011667, partial [Ladona fulva]